MAIQNVDNQTIVTSFADNSVEILTYYSDGLPLILSSFVSIYKGTIQAISFVEGHLIVSFKAYGFGLITVWVDSNGHLFINAPDATSYSIDTNGHLNYTE